MNGIFSRRQVVQAMASFAGMSLLPGVLLAAGDEKPLMMGEGRLLIVGGDNSIHVFDAQKLQPLMKVEVGFPVHSFVPHGSSMSRLWGIQKKAYLQQPDAKHVYEEARTAAFKAVEIDLLTGTVISVIEAPAPLEFRGHGFFFPGTETLFISANDMEKSTGRLAGFDTASGKKVADFFIEHGGIHQARYAGDNTALVVTSGIKVKDGEVTRFNKSCIHRVDLTNGQHLSHSFIEDDEQMLGHFEVLKDGRIIAVSLSIASQLQTKSGPSGKVYIGAEGGELMPLEFTLKSPLGIKPSEMFSIAVDAKDHHVAVSDYVNEILLLFDLNTGKLIKQRKLDVYSAIYDNRKEHFLLCGNAIHAYDDNVSHEVGKFSPRGIFKGPFIGNHAVIL